VSAAIVLLLFMAASASAEEGDYNGEADVETVPDAVRVTLVKMGGEYAVQSVSEGASAAHVGCTWTLAFAPDLDDTPYGISAGPMPDPGARFAMLLCNGSLVRPVWVAPGDVVDLDAVVRGEAQRYVEDVLTPVVGIGVNPAAKGLVGLRSWFWVEGFSGEVVAPPISAFGLSIEVRMTSDHVDWDFGDGSTLRGDLGRAYPQESSVQHAHQRDGSFRVTAVIDLVPEYRVNGGPWLTLPGLSATAFTVHPVEQRQPVVTSS
jgi:hypothetical protein